MSEKKVKKEQKFCVNCEHYYFFVPYPGTLQNRDSCEPRCTHEKTRIFYTSPVYGKVSKLGERNCEKLRRQPQFCGPSAKWYEEKERPKPLCMNCRWYDWSWPTCTHKNNTEDGLVIGGSIRVSNDLYEIRREESLCGPYGNWFEQRVEPPKPLPEQIAPPVKPKKRSFLCRLICGGRND